MSRIGKQPIKLVSGVTYSLQGETLTVTGPKGVLTWKMLPWVSITEQDGALQVAIEDSTIAQQRAYWGLTRACIANMVIGVSEGYKKSLEIQGVGYKFEVTSPTKLTLAVGFSHKVVVEAPKGVTIEADKDDKNKIHLLSHDKQLLGYFAAYVRSIKKPEPYKGKGIRYVGEVIRRKAGKTAGK